MFSKYGVLYQLSLIRILAQYNWDDNMLSYNCKPANASIIQHKTVHSYSIGVIDLQSDKVPFPDRHSTEQKATFCF